VQVGNRWVSAPTSPQVHHAGACSPTTSHLGQHLLLVARHPALLRELGHGVGLLRLGQLCHVLALLRRQRPPHELLHVQG
jgi:hypothetical protein